MVYRPIKKNNTNDTKKTSIKNQKQLYDTLTKYGIKSLSGDTMHPAFKNIIKKYIKQEKKAGRWPIKEKTDVKIKKKK